MVHEANNVPPVSRQPKPAQGRMSSTAASAKSSRDVKNDVRRNNPVKNSTQPQAGNDDNTKVAAPDSTTQDQNVLKEVMFSVDSSL